MENINVAIENLIAYGITKLGYKQEDKEYARNQILDALKIYDFVTCDCDADFVKTQVVPDEIFTPFTKYAIENGIIEEIDSDVFATKLISFVTPLPSVVNDKFQSLIEKNSKTATDYLFDLSIKNYYIQKTATDKNIYWKTDVADGNYLEITINLSKPEKSNADIAKLLTQAPKNKYPLCPLCKENVGFNGGTARNPRQTLRAVEAKLGGDKWHMQYSPYVYYNEHTICFADIHANMVINENTMEKICDYVETFPHYFVGSNADLPIVGGSILNHEHFQGGGHLFPMHFSDVEKTYECDGFDVKIQRINWLNSVVRVSGKNKAEVSKVCGHILKEWRSYSDESVGILSETTAPHNTITPVGRMLDDEFSIDLILRNNRTSEDHPGGIYHAHSEHHPIKSEGIGIIEAMGMFILPARLKRQLALVSEYLQGNIDGFDGYEILQPHAEMLANAHGKSLSKEVADSVVKSHVETTCREILGDTAVFKKDKKGENAFEKFIKVLGFKEV
ncbi:MAG: UDP-glucose--hexose-1-phosphate uridylyltransferase [Bacillota bacterium]